MPTVSRSTITTVTDTTNIKVDLTEVIDMLSPTDVPILQTVGQNSLRTPCTQVMHEWLEDELRPRASALAAAYTAGSGTLKVTTGHGVRFYVDDLIMVGDNILQIVAGPPDSDTFTVIGGIGGSTDASAASAAVVTKVAHAAPEGGVSRVDATKTHLAKPYNYTQILKDWCTLTGTMEVISRYGYVSERAYQEQKILQQLAIDLEYAILYGVRSYEEGPPRRSTMGGLMEYVLLAGISGSWSHVKDLNGQQFTETNLNDTLQVMWALGGQPNLMVVNGYNKRLITQWTTPRIRTERDERMGGASVGTYESEFGTISILLSRHLRASDVLLLTTSEIGLGPLTGRQFSSRLLPSLGDYTQSEILGEYTMEVRKASAGAHGWIYNTSTSG